MTMEGTWDPSAPTPAPDLPSLLGALYEPGQLVTLAQALGGGMYPGEGSGQNDTMPLVDSVAPGFPLNLTFLVPANTVKQQLVRLSFQPQAFRTYVSPTPHSHVGDTHSIHVHTVAATLAHGNTGIETVGHFHKVQLRHGLAADETPGYNRANELFTTSDSVDHNSPTQTDVQVASDHGHSGSALHTTGYIDQTSVSNSNTGGTATPAGVQEGTSPDAMHVMVDGTDVTTQLGGPFTTAQTELDITPYVAPGKGLHTVQVTTATNLGRIAGFVRHKAIVNNLGTLA